MKEQKLGILSITVSLNDIIQHYDMEIPLGKGDLPLLVFCQSANGHPSFETFDRIEDASNRCFALEKLGRTPQTYVRLPAKRRNRGRTK